MVTNAEKRKAAVLAKLTQLINEGHKNDYDPYSVLKPRLVREVKAQHADMPKLAIRRAIDQLAEDGQIAVRKCFHPHRITTPQEIADAKRRSATRRDAEALEDHGSADGVEKALELEVCAIVEAIQAAAADAKTPGAQDDLRCALQEWREKLGRGV